MLYGHYGVLRGSDEKAENGLRILMKIDLTSDFHFGQYVTSAEMYFKETDSEKSVSMKYSKKAQHAKQKCIKHLLCIRHCKILGMRLEEMKNNKIYR